MTTAELAYRLLRHATVTDLAALNFSQATELAGAISFAVGEYYRTGPSMLRKASASAMLAAPRTVSGLQVAAGALEVTAGVPFTLDQRGSSLDIAGDENRNVIVSTVGWLNAYQGTTGTKTATVYGDCVPISSRVLERFVSAPWIMDGDRRRGDLRRARDEHRLGHDRAPTTGWPEEYAIETLGTSRGATAQYFLRVWPVPQQQMVIRFEIEATPEAYDQSCIADIVLELPFSDMQVETIILPIAEQRLLASTLFDELRDQTIAVIDRDAERARQFLKALPRDHGKPAGRIRTKPGW